MDFTDIFKRAISGGLFASPDEEEKRKRLAAQAVPLGAALPSEEQNAGLFSGLLPDDPMKREALGNGLLNAGAAMMVAGGPSRDPTNLLSVIGSGVGTGAQAYQNYRKDAVAIGDAKAKADALKRGQALADELGNSVGADGTVSAMGLSMDELMKVWRYQIATGDEAGARDTLGMIQQLRLTLAKAGMVVGEDGSAKLAAGYGDSLNETERQKASGRIEGEESQKQTDDIREYNLYVEQATSKGEEPEDFTTWMRKGKAAGATQVNVGENTKKFAEKADENAAKRYDEIAAAGASAGQMVGDMEMLLELGRKVKTGKGAELTAALGPWADMVGISTDGLAPAQAYDAIVSRIAPNMRPAGAGATSDFDAKQYLKSIPSLGNTPEGNEVIAHTMKAIAQNKIDAAEIANRVFRGEITWQDGDKEISALPNPYARFKQFQKQKQEKGPMKVLRTETAPMDDGNSDETVSAYPKLNSPEEAHNLPDDIEFFYTPDGVRKRNPRYRK